MSATPFYEPFLSRHFPAWGERRELARTKSAAYATYRGAIQTRTSTAFERHRSLRGSKLVERRQLADMGDRARRVFRNNPIGRSLLVTETDSIIADGLNLQAGTQSEPFNQEVEEKWWAWLNQADLRGMMTGPQLMRQSWLSPRRDGDGGFVLVSQPGGVSRLQFIPRDLIQDPTDKKFDRRTMFDGVQCNPAGRPVAFHILDEDEWGKRRFATIPAADFVYLPHLDDDLAVRGATCYQTIFDILDQLEGYVDAVVIAARMAAVFGLIFKTETGAKQVSGLPILQDSDGTDRRALTMEHGMLNYLGTKEDVVQVNPQQPMTQTPDFIRALFRIACLAFDAPLEIGSKDLSQVNFSGGRIGLIQWYRTCRAKLAWNVDTCWSRIYRWWLDREVKMGRIVAAVPPGRGLDGRPAFEAHEFHGREWDMNDPVAEAQADLLEQSIGLGDVQTAAAKRGRDWRAIHRNNTLIRAARQKDGMPNVLSNYVRTETEAAPKVPLAPDSSGAPAVEAKDGEPGTEGAGGAAARAVAPETLDRIKGEADAFGVCVRAGALTPTVADEEHFRTQMNLPPLSDAAKAAWEKDAGTRRPITITPPAGTESPGPGPVPDEENPAEESEP